MQIFWSEDKATGVERLNSTAATTTASLESGRSSHPVDVQVENILKVWRDLMLRRDKFLSQA